MGVKNHAAAPDEFKEDAEVRFHLGLSYAAAGRRGEALSQTERALSGVRAGARAEEMRAALDSRRRPAR